MTNEQENKAAAFLLRELADITEKRGRDYADEVQEVHATLAHIREKQPTAFRDALVIMERVDDPLHFIKWTPTL